MEHLQLGLQPVALLFGRDELGPGHRKGLLQVQHLLLQVRALLVDPLVLTLPERHFGVVRQLALAQLCLKPAAPALRVGKTVLPVVQSLLQGPLPGLDPAGLLVGLLQLVLERLYPAAAAVALLRRPVQCAQPALHFGCDRGTGLLHVREQPCDKVPGRDPFAVEVPGHGGGVQMASGSIPADSGTQRGEDRSQALGKRELLGRQAVLERGEPYRTDGGIERGGTGARRRSCVLHPASIAITEQAYRRAVLTLRDVNSGRAAASLVNTVCLPRQPGA